MKIPDKKQTITENWAEISRKTKQKPNKINSMNLSIVRPLECKGENVNETK